jgi:purine catabolism regulator
MVSTANVRGGEAQELTTISADGAGHALHDRLSQRVLAGDGLAEIAGEVAHELGVGVLVTSTDGREWAGALTSDLRARLAVAELVDETGRLRVERLAAPVALGAGEVRMLPVQAPRADLARLIAVASERTLDEVDLQALARSATVIALWTSREQAVSAVEHKYRGDFLRDVLLGRAGSVDFVLEHAADFGWDLTRPAVVLSAQIDPQPAEEEPADQYLRRSWQERFAAAWRQVMTATDPTGPSADFSSEVVTLVPVPPDGDPGPLVARVVHAVAGDKGGGRRPFTVGVSRVAAGVAGLPEAYGQARRALEVGRRVHGSGSTTWFDQLGLHRLIAMVPDSAELDAFARDVLGDLAADTEEAVTLRHTLQVLLDTNFNVAEAARTQFFHYNTMRYRVGKLERLLGPLSTDPMLRLDVAVALKVLEITG